MNTSRAYNISIIRFSLYPRSAGHMWIGPVPLECLDHPLNLMRLWVKCFTHVKEKSSNFRDVWLYESQLIDALTYLHFSKRLPFLCIV